MVVKKKNLLEEAIAEAKMVREAAIQNATRQLEENLTPSIKEMLAKKLEEDLDINESEEEDINENANSGFKEVKPKKNVNEEEDPKDDENAPADDENDVPADDDADAEDAPVDDESEEEDVPADDDEDSDVPAEEEDEVVDDDTPLKDITLGDLRDIISDLVAASAAPAPGGNEGVDLDPGDVEGAGEETPAGDLAATGDEDADLPADPAAAEDSNDDDDEIDISEILREIENEEKGNACPKCGKEQCVCKENKQNDEMPENQNGKEHHKEPNEGGPSQDSELNEAKKKIASLRKKNKELQEGLQKCMKTLKDINVLNSKLTVTSKLLSKPNLTESQKANIIATVDKAKSSKEAIALGKTLLEGLRNPKRQSIAESRRGSASRPAGTSTSGATNLVDEGMVRRFQELAGIIK